MKTVTVLALLIATTGAASAQSFTSEELQHALRLCTGHKIDGAYEKGWEACPAVEKEWAAYSERLLKEQKENEQRALQKFIR